MACPTGNEPELNEEVTCIYEAARDRVRSSGLWISSWILFQTGWVDNVKYCVDAVWGPPQKWLHKMMPADNFTLLSSVLGLSSAGLAWNFPHSCSVHLSTSIHTPTPLVPPPGLLNKNNIYLPYLLILSILYWFLGLCNKLHWVEHLQNKMT